VGHLRLQRHIFRCRRRFYPRPKFQWQFNGAPIGNATDSSLLIASATTNDACAYNLVITNGVESVHRHKRDPHVIAEATPPAILSAPKNLAAYIGQTASFSVQPRAIPRRFTNGNSTMLPSAGQTTIN